MPTDVLDAKKRDQRAGSIRERLAEEATDLVNVTPIHELVKEEDIARLWQAVTSLVPEQRLAVMLHYRDGMSYREVSELLDIPTGTIKWRISEALIQLRLELAGDLAQYENE